MPTKEEREARALELQWQKAVQACAIATVSEALTAAGLPVTDQGGLVVQLNDPEGRGRRFYVRLTEVK